MRQGCQGRDSLAAVALDPAASRESVAGSHQGVRFVSQARLTPIITAPCQGCMRSSLKRGGGWEMGEGGNNGVMGCVESNRVELIGIDATAWTCLYRSRLPSQARQ